MKLLGVDLPEGAAVRPGKPLPITLYFSTPHVIDGFYTLFIHLADEKDRLLYQFDGVPAQGRHPTRQWLPGGIFADSYSIAVNQPTYDGPATLSLGFYQYTDKSKRQALINANGDRVVLAQVRVHNNTQTTPLNPKPVARWANGLQLATAQIERDQANFPVAVHVQWQTTAVVQTNYTVFVQLLDKAGKLLAQIDHQPQNGAYPTSTWQPGDSLADEYRFAPPSSESKGQWDQLIIGLYDPAQKRLLLQPGGETQADFFVLLQQNAGTP